MTSEREPIENDILAVMRSDDDLREAVADLQRQGFDRDGIRVIQPEEAPGRIDAQGKRSGILERAARHVQSTLSDENQLLGEYEEAAGEGAEILVVHVAREEDIGRARDVILAHNGENIRHFGSWAVTDLENQGRASS